MMEGKSCERTLAGSHVSFFTRFLSVTMCSLGRVNILSSARPRTIKLYASARWLAKTRISHSRAVGLISNEQASVQSGARVSHTNVSSSAVVCSASLFNFASFLHNFIHLFTRERTINCELNIHISRIFHWWRVKSKRKLQIFGE